MVVVCYLWVCLGDLTRGKISSLGSQLGLKIRKEVLEKSAECWGYMTQISMAQMYHGFPYSFEVSPSSNTVTARELEEMYFKWAESCWKWLERQKRLYPSHPTSVKVFWELRWKQGTGHTSVTLDVVLSSKLRYPVQHQGKVLECADLGLIPPNRQHWT